ncbi:unnamed protein product, partial [Iphiclides podalirius]
MVLESATWRQRGQLEAGARPPAAPRLHKSPRGRALSAARRFLFFFFSLPRAARGNKSASVNVSLVERNFANSYAEWASREDFWRTHPPRYSNRGLDPIEASVRPLSGEDKSGRADAADGRN